MTRQFLSLFFLRREDSGPRYLRGWRREWTRGFTEPRYPGDLRDGRKFGLLHGADRANARGGLQSIFIIYLRVSSDWLLPDLCPMGRANSRAIAHGYRPRPESSSNPGFFLRKLTPSSTFPNKVSSEEKKFSISRVNGIHPEKKIIGTGHLTRRTLPTSAFFSEKFLLQTVIFIYELDSNFIGNQRFCKWQSIILHCHLVGNTLSNDLLY